MHDCYILLLVVAIILVIVTALGLNTFLRLNNASKEFGSNDAYEDACHLSLTYTKGAMWLFSILFVFSLFFLARVSFILAKQS